MCSRRSSGCLLGSLLVLVLLCGGALSVVYWLVGPSSACKEPAQDAARSGTSARKLVSGGWERCYLFYLPPGLDPAKPAPVVVSLHGFASNAASQELLARWNRIADEEGFVVVYPEGTSFPLRWNVGGMFFSQWVDDVRFFRDVITDLTKVVAIDPARIYVTGMSNGGAMANRIACEATDVVAAAGTVVRYEGGAYQIPALVQWVNLRGATFTYPPVATWIAGWAERDGCSLMPEGIPAAGDARGSRYTDCQGDAEVVLYTIEGGAIPGQAVWLSRI